MENRKNAILLELPYNGFSVSLTWIPDDKAASEVARSIVKESFLHKGKAEKIIAEKGMKHTEAYVFALGKEHSLKKGFTKDLVLFFS